MKEIKKKKVTREELSSLGIDITNWSNWDCEPSEFDWEYSSAETAFVFEGDVEIITENGTTVIGPGDLVRFPGGMKCRWKVKKTIKKVYTFNDIDF